MKKLQSIEPTWYPPVPPVGIEHRAQMALAFATEHHPRLATWADVNPAAALKAATRMSQLRPHEAPEVYALDLSRLLRLGTAMSVLDFLQLLNLLEPRL